MSIIFGLKLLVPVCYVLCKLIFNIFNLFNVYILYDTHYHIIVFYFENLSNRNIKKKIIIINIIKLCINIFFIYKKMTQVK